MTAVPGSRLGPYEIIKLLGRGGMGAVYEAIDTRMSRKVAIKMLDPAHADRFKREAHAIAALNHPHICTLYDIGPDYLVMEYIEGTKLRGPLAPAEAVRVTLEIAEALEAAHAKGIIHRDLKPANVMVTRVGGVKLLDFGLAKPLGGATSAESTVTETEAGTILGTASYMSPEQAAGKPIDARSDIFAFGVLLYELLSGRRAFRGDNSISIMAAILHTEPAPLQAPAKIAQIVNRCLRKSAADRFQTMAEVKRALAAVARDDLCTVPTPSIAVLPFANLSPDRDNEYFSDGLAEEIIGILARAPGLKVIARTSAFAFRGKEQDIRAIAQLLNVRTVLEGSVRRAGNRIRVTAQLISAEDGTHVWAERYDRELTDVFAVQDEIAAAIAEALRVKLARKRADRQEHEPNAIAYEEYLKGLHHLFKNTPEGLAKSKNYFRRAVELDPEYAAAHVALGQCYGLTGLHGVHPSLELMPLVRSEALQTLDLDPSSSLAQAMLGMVAAILDHDWSEADQRFRIAMADSPVPGVVRWPYANFWFSPRGQFREAAEQMEKWLDQDPLNVIARADLAFFLNHAELYDRANASARLALEVDDKYWFAHYVLGEICWSEGMLKEALSAAESAYRLAPWNPRVIGLLAGILTRSGNKHRAGTLLQQIQGAGPVGMLVYHLVTSETGAAVECFREAIQQREFFPVIYARAPITGCLRRSDHWPALARMMNLPEVA